MSDVIERWERRLAKVPASRCDAEPRRRFLQRGAAILAGLLGIGLAQGSDAKVVKTCNFPYRFYDCNRMCGSNPTRTYRGPDFCCKGKQYKYEETFCCLGRGPCDDLTIGAQCGAQYYYTKKC